MLHLFSSRWCSLRRHNIRTLSDACACLSLLLLPRLLHFNCPSSFPSSLLSLSQFHSAATFFHLVPLLFCFLLGKRVFVFWLRPFHCAVCVCVCLTGIIVVSELEICWSSQQRTQSGGHQDSAMLLLLLLIRVCTVQYSYLLFAWQIQLSSSNNSRTLLREQCARQAKWKMITSTSSTVSSLSLSLNF